MMLRKRSLERVDEIVGVLTDGQRYLVPTVKGEWLNNHGIAEWPVIGPRHKDTDLGVQVSHYHIDLRFVPFKEHVKDKNTLVNESCDAPVRYKPWLCLQARLVIGNVEAPKIAGFNDRWKGVKCKGSQRKGWVCPHRNIWLGSQLVYDGMITCPGHGLVIDATSGCVLP